MRKVTTLLFVVLLTTIGNWHSSYGQYRNVYHINESFDGLTALPSGWKTQTGNPAIYFRSGGTSFKDGAMFATGGGSGNRGGDIIFPTPQSNEEIGTSPVWFVEFDVVVNKANLGPRNTAGLIFSGSTSQNVSNDTDWFAASIFGLYTFGDGFWHYINMDLVGPDQEPDQDLSVYNGKMGPVFDSGQNARFRWAGGQALNLDLKDDEAAAANVARWNATTKTDVTFEKEVVYHITARMNFDDQVVESLIIEEKENSGNRQEFTNMKFMATSPLAVGTNPLVPEENRKVTDINILSTFNTRTSSGGSGGNSDLEMVFDDFKVYYQVPSAGQETVTIWYKDQDGGNARDPKVLPNTEVGEVIELADVDMQSFVEGANYFRYDADKTTEKSLTVTSGATNELTVYFVKAAAVAGTYVWAPTGSIALNETDGNFTVNGQTGVAYQANNTMEFANGGIPAAVLSAPVNLGTANAIVSADEFTLNNAAGSEGELTGTGALIVNGAAIFEQDFVNNLEGGLEVNTTGSIPTLIHSKKAAKKIKIGDGGKLRLKTITDRTEAGGVDRFNTPIEGAGEGSTINLYHEMNVDGYDFASPITNASVINIHALSWGRQVSSHWDSQLLATFPAGAQVKLYNAITEKDTLAGFGVIRAGLDNVRLHLGDKVRAVRNYNEANSATAVAIGGLSGDPGSFLEGGFVNGRGQIFSIGGLNTDEVFAGTIRQFMKANDFGTSTVSLRKVGTGNWTISGDITTTGTITAAAGTLELTGTVAESMTPITVLEEAVLKTGFNPINAPSIEIEAGGTLIANSTPFANAYVNVLGTASGSFSASAIAINNGQLNLSVNSFTSGDHDVVEGIGGIGVSGTDAKINITVKQATEGSTIQLLKAPQIVWNDMNVTVSVNGEDITNNTETTPGAKFVWNFTTGELKSLVTGEFSGIESLNPEGKTVESVEYYDGLGRVTSKDAKGIVIRKLIYDDNTSKVEKILNN